MTDIHDLQSISSTGNIADDVRSILRESRQIVVRHTNTAMTAAYWMIGRRIVIEEQKGEATAAYGEGLLKNLSKELIAEFGNGFSYANLRNMRQFYLTYCDSEICQTLSSKLPWSHNCLIMRVADPKAREWYLREATREQWSVRQLERNINSFYYQRQLECGLAGDSTQEVANSSDIDVRQFVKDPYVLEFVGLPVYPQHKEKELEDVLVDKMQDFLLELGKGFSFIKRQYRISTETCHFYIDLVFYNYVLKCFVLIDLKTDKLTHQDVGQIHRSNKNVITMGNMNLFIAFEVLPASCCLASQTCLGLGIAQASLASAV